MTSYGYRRNQSFYRGGLASIFFFRRHTRQMSTKNIKLDPHWISGFSDAESSFVISIIRKKGLKLG